MGNEESIYLDNLSILIVGKPKVGKTQLVYSILNYKFDEDNCCLEYEYFYKYTAKKSHISLYESHAFPSNPREQQEYNTIVKTFLNAQSHMEDIDQKIHCIWYCIDSKSCQIDEYEKQFISLFSQDIPIIVVITKSDDEDTIFRTMTAIESSELNIKKIVPVLSENTKLLNSYGLDNLIYYTVKSLPSNIKPACKSYYNIINQIEDVYDEENLTTHVNILLTGKIGVGKSTLINSIFNFDLANEDIGDSITNQIEEYTSEDSIFTLIDTPGLCTNPQNRKEIQKQILKKIKEKNNENDIEKKIHCIWYCVDCQASRIEEEELNFIKQFKNIPVIIVLTQSYFENDKNKMINFIREKKLKNIYPIISKRGVLGTKTYEPYGIEDLLDKSKQLSNYKDPLYDEQRNKAGENIEQNAFNVIITGKTGTGKSTLINCFFNGFLAATGIGLPITQNIREITTPYNPITIYDTPGLEMSKSQQKELKKDIIGLVKKGISTGDTNKFIHCIWYCVRSGSSRFEKDEADFIKELTEDPYIGQIPFIIVMTQSYNQEVTNRLISHINSFNLNQVEIVPIVAKDKIDHDNVIKAFGIERLAEVMNNSLPGYLRASFASIQKASLKLKRNCAIGAISGFVAAASAIGASPIPFSDCALLVPNEIAMLSTIAAIYGVSVTKGFISTVLACTIGASSTSLLGRFAVVNLIKLIPGAGSIAGGVISGSTAAVLTGALGAAYAPIMEAIVKGEIDPRKISKEELKERISSLFTKKLKILSKKKNGEILIDEEEEEEHEEEETNLGKDGDDEFKKDGEGRKKK